MYTNKINIVRLLARRDGISAAEAENEIESARQEMESYNYDCDECERIMYETLGLEPDYIFDIIF